MLDTDVELEETPSIEGGWEDCVWLSQIIPRQETDPYFADFFDMVSGA